MGLLLFGGRKERLVTKIKGKHYYAHAESFVPFRGAAFLDYSGRLNNPIVRWSKFQRAVCAYYAYNRVIRMRYVYNFISADEHTPQVSR